MEHPPLGDEGDRAPRTEPERRDTERRQDFRRREDVDLRVAVENLTTAVRAHNKESAWLRRRIRRQAYAFFVVLFLTVGGAFGLEHRYAQRNEEGLVASCDRVNRLRSQDNENATQIWAALYAGGEREHQLAKTGTAPTRETHKLAALVYDVLAGAMRHTALTDCFEAIHRPKSYNAPSPAPFHPSTDFPEALKKVLEQTPLSPTPQGP